MTIQIGLVFVWLIFLIHYLVVNASVQQLLVPRVDEKLLLRVSVED